MGAQNCPLLLSDWQQEQRRECPPARLRPQATDAFTAIHNGYTGWQNSKAEPINPSIKNLLSGPELLDLLSGINTIACYPQGEISATRKRTPLPRRKYPEQTSNKRGTTPTQTSSTDGQRHKKTTFQCHLCDHVTCLKGNLTQHLKTHQPKAVRLKPHLCQQCDYATDHKGCLNKHLNTHLPKDKRPKPFPCHQCNYTTDERRALRQHLEKHKPAEEQLNLHRCHLCNYATGHHSDLKKHLHHHIPLNERPKPFPCHQCNYATDNKGSLKTHLKKHKTTHQVEGTQS